MWTRRTRDLRAVYPPPFSFRPVYLTETFRNKDAMSLVDTIVLIVMCILLPPLAVYFKRRHCDKHFCINILLTLLGWIPGRCL